MTAFQTSPRWETVRTRRGTRRRASIAATVGLLLTLSSCGEVGQKQGQASGSDQLATELVSGVAVHLNDVGASPRLQIRLKGSAWTTVSLPSEKTIGRLEVGPGKSTSEMLVVATDCLPEGDENCHDSAPRIFEVSLETAAVSEDKAALALIDKDQRALATTSESGQTVVLLGNSTQNDARRRYTMLYRAAFGEDWRRIDGPPIEQVADAVPSEIQICVVGGRPLALEKVSVPFRSPPEAPDVEGLVSTSGPSTSSPLSTEKYQPPGYKTRAWSWDGAWQEQEGLPVRLEAVDLVCGGDVASVLSVGAQSTELWVSSVGAKGGLRWSSAESLLRSANPPTPPSLVAATLGVGVSFPLSSAPSILLRADGDSVSVLQIEPARAIASEEDSRTAAKRALVRQSGADSDGLVTLADGTAVPIRDLPKVASLNAQ